MCKKDIKYNLLIKIRNLSDILINIKNKIETTLFEMHLPYPNSSPTFLAPFTAPHYSRQPSKYIKKYVINFQSPIGKGNFSTVYAASNVYEPGAKYAVKLVNVANLRQKKIQHLARAQIQMLKAVNHKNVISCKDVFYDESWTYLVTDYYEGGNLENIIKKLKYVSQAQILPIIKDIFQGLRYLEKCKIIHRDIKAANIFVNEGRAVVADLGFAKFFYQPFCDLHIGSLSHMPPETLSRGLYSNKTDVWAFGILLCQIFHGQSPFAKCLDMNDLIRNAHVPLSVMNLRSDLSIEMKQLILSCLQIDFEKRPKFSQIQHTWYFQKLYPYNIMTKSNIIGNLPPLSIYSSSYQNAESNLTYRSPLKSINMNNNNNQSNQSPRYLSPTSKYFSKLQPKVLTQQKCSYFTQQELKSPKSPAFSKINKLKQDIRRNKQENTISVFYSHLVQNDRNSIKYKQQLQQKIEKISLSRHNSLQALASQLQLNPLNNEEDTHSKTSYAKKVKTEQNQQQNEQKENKLQNIDDIIRKINNMQKNINIKQDIINKYNKKSNTEAQLQLQFDLENKQNMIGGTKGIKNKKEKKYQFTALKQRKTVVN